jgi:hypothetical protein
VPSSRCTADPERQPAVDAYRARGGLL